MSRMSQEDDEFEEEVQRQIRGQEFAERQDRAFDEAWRRRRQKRERTWKWWVNVVLHSLPVLAFLVFMSRVLWNKYG